MGPEVGSWKFWSRPLDPTKTTYYNFRAWVPERLGFWLITRKWRGYFIGTYAFPQWLLTREQR